MLGPSLRQSARLASAAARRYASSTQNRSPNDEKVQPPPNEPASQAVQPEQQPSAAQGASSKRVLDLTQTGPSLAEEYMEISEVAPAGSSSSFPGERTGAKAKGADSKSTAEKARQRYARYGFGLLAVGTVGVAAYASRDWDSEEERARITSRTEDMLAIEQSNQGGVMGRWGRAKLRVEDTLDYLNKPAWDPLLPAPLPEPHYRPYTLVVDLDDLLVHSGWDIEHGWRTAKRPGVDYFLAYLSQFYEIVLFTTQPAYTAAPIVEKIDPYGAYIPWKLFRESTRYKNRALIKDLTYLGRPLERTIVLDTKPEHVQLQPENSILLKPWEGRRDASAKELVALIPFLEALAIKRVKDVRPVIKHYEGKNIPIAYAEAEAKQKQELVQKWEHEREVKSGVTGAVASLFGSIVKNPSPTGPPLTEVERVRQNAQKIYLEEQKYWRDNEALIKQQMEEDRQRQLKEMRGSFASFISGGGMKPPEQQQT